LAVPLVATDKRVAAVVPDVTERLLDEFVEGEETTEPSVPTMRWAEGGAPCADCGETVTRRWRDGEAFVCADCKDW
jgi:hypothetical protein